MAEWVALLKKIAKQERESSKPAAIVEGKELKKGDTAILLSNQGGQDFVVLGRKVK